jgi:hypothetical protein
MRSPHPPQPPPPPPDHGVPAGARGPDGCGPADVRAGRGRDVQARRRACVQVRVPTGLLGRRSATARGCSAAMAEQRWPSSGRDCTVPRIISPTPRVSSCLRVASDRRSEDHSTKSAAGVALVTTCRIVWISGGAAGAVRLEHLTLAEADVRGSLLYMLHPGSMHKLNAD